MVTIFSVEKVSRYIRNLFNIKTYTDFHCDWSMIAELLKRCLSLHQTWKWYS